MDAEFQELVTPYLDELDRLLHGIVNTVRNMLDEIDEAMTEIATKQLGNLVKGRENG